jgi:hypothetical protein
LRWLSLISLDSRTDISDAWSGPYFNSWVTIIPKRTWRQRHCGHCWYHKQNNLTRNILLTTSNMAAMTSPATEEYWPQRKGHKWLNQVFVVDIFFFLLACTYLLMATDRQTILVEFTREARNTEGLYPCCPCNLTRAYRNSHLRDRKHFQCFL